MASWTEDTPAASGLENARMWPALLAPELPYVVMPRALRAAIGNQEENLPSSWGTHPVPPWRGVPCRVSSVVMRVVNEVARPDPMEFRLLVLVPDRDPPGPRTEHVLLGTQFFTHYALRVAIDYSSLRHLDERTAKHRYDPSTPCGTIETD
jgi:hypothetical protein